MGIFARLAQLIKSNINDLISRSEDPEKMLNQIIIDMNNQLVEATRMVAAAVADEKRLAHKLEQEQQTCGEWRRRAEMAVRAGNDELAREALARKREHDVLREGYHAQWEKQKASVEQLKKALRMLNRKIEEAKRKKNLLIAQKQRAEAQKAIHQAMSTVGNNSAFDTFDRMAERIQRMEAEADASSELVQEASGDTLRAKFDELEATAGADMDLLALKQEMGLVAPPPAPSATQPVAEPMQMRVPSVATAPESAEQLEEDELAAALAELDAEEQAAKRQFTR